jgi:hypothetical protein
LSWRFYQSHDRPVGWLCCAATDLEARRMLLRCAIAVALLPPDQVFVQRRPQVSKQRLKSGYEYYAVGARVAWRL